MIPGRLAEAGRQALSRLEPETAHRLAIRALTAGLALRLPAAQAHLRKTVCGLDFASPVGVAAGFDKNAEVPHRLLALGFGFVEVGTLTPRPQRGNPRPRLFRLAEDHALINRLGFNNEGHAAARERLARRPASGIVGVNIGANRDSADRIADYVAGVEAFHDVADYLAINVSSPNTPGLRDLQERSQLRALLDAVVTARERRAGGGGGRPPVFVKLAPDLDDAAIEAIAGVLLDAGADGVIATNTTLARPANLASPHAAETGGLSGAPLFERSTVVLARLHKALGGRLPIIGVGGVMSGRDAFAKIAAGASLVALYTGLVYRGLPLVEEIHDHLAAECARRGFARLADAVGCECDAWAATPLT